MANYFNTLSLRDQLHQLGQAEFMDSSEFSDGVSALKGKKIAIIKSSAGIHEKVLEFEKREPSHEIVENEYLDKRDDVFTM